MESQGRLTVACGGAAGYFAVTLRTASAVSIMSNTGSARGKADEVDCKHSLRLRPDRSGVRRGEGTHAGRTRLQGAHGNCVHPRVLADDRDSERVEAVGHRR